MKTLFLLCFLASSAVFAEKSVPELLKDLESPTWRIRKAATVELAERKEESIPALLKLLQSDNLEPAFRAKTALIHMAIEGDDALAELILAKLSALDLKGVAEGAAKAARSRILPVRKERTVKRFLEAGGKITSYPNGNQYLVVDEGFTGDDKTIEKVLRYPFYSIQFVNYVINENLFEKISQVPNLKRALFQKTGLTSEEVENLMTESGLDYTQWSAGGLVRSHHQNAVTGSLTLMVASDFEGDIEKAIEDDYTRIDIRGVEVPKSLVETFKNKKSLKSVILWGTGLHTKDVDTLRSRVPRLSVSYRGGAFLGVQTRMLIRGKERQIKIVDVLEGSPADVAGLKSGDIALELNGKKLHTYLNAATMAEKMPGEKMSFRVKRGDSQYDFIVTLGRVTNYKRITHH